MAPRSRSSSSSSGFSSDDDDDREYEESVSVSVAASSVPVDVIDDDDAEDEAAAQPSPADADLDDDSEPLESVDVDALATHIDAQCIAAVQPLLQGPLSFHYDQFTAAIDLVTASFPAASFADEGEDDEDDPKVLAYRMLRSALYARFQRAFPLTPEMYAQWLADLPESDAQAKQRVFALATRDYQSVPLSLQYMQFLHGYEGDPTETPSTKAAMELMLRTVGTHYALGHTVWQFYRELVQQDDSTTPLAKEQHVRALFSRQMTLPLQQNDLAMSEFRAWNNYNTLEPDAKRREQLFDDAVKRQTKIFGPLAKKMNQFEERLQAAASGQSDEVSLEQVWLQYINFVTYRIVPLMESDGDEDDEAPRFTGDDVLTCVFERAVAMVCLSATLWSKYAAFLSSASGASDAERLGLYQRAVRNVSFDSTMWNDLLLEMERQKVSIEKISRFFKSEITSRTNPLMMDAYHFLSVLITYCDIHRRHAALHQYNVQAMARLEQAFKDCEAFCVTELPEFPVGAAKIMEYHAKCSLLSKSFAATSTRHATKFAKWNALWNQILQQRSSEAEVWLSYYQESVRTGAKPTSQEIRTSVFERAMQSVADYPASVLEVWLVFERENGSLQDFFHVRQLHADLLAKTAAQAAEVAAAASAEAAAAAQPEPRKRKASDSKVKAEPKRAKPTPAPRQPDEQPKPAAAKPAKADKSSTTVEKKKVHETLTNAHTLFVSSISKDVTKEELEALFHDIPGFKEVRLVVKARANHVKSRGMAYIQFSDEQGVDAGLLKHGLELKGQAMSIEKSKPPVGADAGAAGAKGKHGGDLSRDGTWKTDPVTIYVGGLVQKVSGEHIGEARLQEGIQQALQSVGELVVVKRVSILKDKRGKLKDYGLVEVATAEQTAQCVAHAEEIQKILGDQISLKPSRFSIDQILLQQQNQMKKKGEGESQTSGGSDEKRRKGDSAQRAKSTGAGAPPAAAAASKPRNSMSLMPRALRRKIAVSNESASVRAGSAAASSAAAATPASSSNPQPTQPTATAGGDSSKPKTNDDFRKMMMKQ